MSPLERLALPMLRLLDPERAHGLALAALRAGLAPLPGPITSPMLQTEIAGLTLPNPVGLAAGFDKNGTAMAQVVQAGFGFVELGATTPRPQPGNPRPRLFRLTEDQAAINRFGFNNQGMKAMSARLANRPAEGVIGLNLGANKDSTDRAADYAAVLATCGAQLDFATVNVSSPNTESLRDLQGKAALTALLEGVFEARDKLDRPVPIFLKIAPDIESAGLEDIAELARALPLDAVIATNTTLSRDGLQSPARGEPGGLSGQPLFERSTRVLAQLSQLTEGAVPLIGVGGVASAEQAFEKLRAGASAVQLYTGLVFGGLSLGAKIAQGLDAMLAERGYTNASQAVGTGIADWT